MSYSKEPVKKKYVTSEKYFKGLVCLPLTAMKNHKNAKSVFVNAMDYPIKGFKKICSKVTLDDNPIEVHRWPGDKEVNKLFNVLKKIDQG